MHYTAGRRCSGRMLLSRDGVAALGANSRHIPGQIIAAPGAMAGTFGSFGQVANQQAVAEEYEAQHQRSQSVRLKEWISPICAPRENHLPSKIGDRKRKKE